MNPEVREVIEPKRTVQVAFFVRKYGQFDFLLQKSEEVGLIGIGSTQV